MAPELLHERVDDEWSFIETLRHLVFATDAWVSRAILGQPSPRDPLGLPHDEMPSGTGVPWDKDARPQLDPPGEREEGRGHSGEGGGGGGEGDREGRVGGLRPSSRGVGAPAVRRTRPQRARIPVNSWFAPPGLPGTGRSGAVFDICTTLPDVNEKSFVARCVTCGSELHPERAEKYGYCMAPECQEKNLKGLTMVAVGVNKSAEQYLLLDEETKDELARGKYRDQRRGSFGTSTSSPPRPAPRQPHPASPAPPAPAPASTSRRPPPVDQVAGETGAALQRAGAAPGRDRAEARPEHLPGHPDHPVFEEPRQAVSTLAFRAALVTPAPPVPDHLACAGLPERHETLVPVRPNALKVRFHGVRRRADPHDQLKLSRIELERHGWDIHAV